MWNEVVVAYFEVIGRYFPGVNKENFETSVWITKPRAQIRARDLHNMERALITSPRHSVKHESEWKDRRTPDPYNGSKMMKRIWVTVFTFNRDRIQAVTGYVENKSNKFPSTLRVWMKHRRCLSDITCITDAWTLEGTIFRLWDSVRLWWM
jgi:hypothetical protein